MLILSFSKVGGSDTQLPSRHLLLAKVLHKVPQPPVQLRGKGQILSQTVWLGFFCFLCPYSQEKRKVQVLTSVSLQV